MYACILLAHTDTFVRLPSYRQHVTRGCTGTPPRRHAYLYECRLCGAQFTGEPNIVGHFKEEHVGEKPFECDKCEHQFWSSLGRLYHSRKCTGRPPTAPCFVAKASECRVCSATFRSHTLLRCVYETPELQMYPNEYRNHFLHEHKSNRPFMCGKCGSTWRFESVAQKHETKCVRESVFDRAIVPQMYWSTAYTASSQTSPVSSVWGGVGERREDNGALQTLARRLASIHVWLMRRVVLLECESTQSRTNLRWYTASKRHVVRAAKGGSVSTVQQADGQHHTASTALSRRAS